MAVWKPGAGFPMPPGGKRHAQFHGRSLDFHLFPLPPPAEHPGKRGCVQVKFARGFHELGHKPPLGSCPIVGLGPAKPYWLSIHSWLRQRFICEFIPSWGLKGFGEFINSFQAGDPGFGNS